MLVTPLSTGNFLAVTNVWDKIVEILINLAVIIIILVVGWVIAVVLGKFVTKILSVLNVDSLLSTFGAREKMEKGGMKISLSQIGGEFVKWVTILLALIAATDFVGLTQVAAFLNAILSFVPNIIVAVLIIVIGMLLADFAYKIVKSSSYAAGLAYSELISNAAKWIVIIFAIFTALDQLGIQLEFVKILFTGVVGMIALAGGIAFGLGGRDMAREALNKMKGEMK